MANEVPVDTLILRVRGGNKARCLLVSAMMARTKYVDAQFLKALEDGARQAVVLGAGLDKAAVLGAKAHREIRNRRAAFHHDVSRCWWIATA
jgi:hypothetical protein